MIDLEKTLKITEKLCIKTGKFLKENQYRATIKKNKSGDDFSTNIDWESEQIIIDSLQQYFPQHNILSEERGLLKKKSDYRWIIDPLDGTREYFRNIPYYFINLALEYKLELILGVVYNPTTGCLFSSAKDLGANCNSKKITVSRRDLKEAYIYTHLPGYQMSPGYFKRAWRLLAKITLNCSRMRAREHDIESLCLIAKGSIEGHFFITESKKWSTKWWDVAAGILMVREAGGKITDLDGNSNMDHNLSRGLVASNGKIHSQLLKILNS